MPALASLAEFRRAVADFPAGELEVAAEPPARAEAERSLAESGFLLLGEVHGARENPLIIRALLRAFGLTSLALEWPAELAPVISAFLAGEALADDPQLWFGDGRITAGHLAVLRERAAAGPLELTLLDGVISADASWSGRDAAMARRLLAGAGTGPGTLVVAGNAHTPVRPTPLGVPLGAVLAARRPGVREIRIDYRGGATTTSRRAGSPRARARAGRGRGSFSATKTSPSYSPPPAKRLFPKGPGRSARDEHRHRAGVPAARHAGRPGQPRYRRPHRPLVRDVQLRAELPRPGGTA